MCLLRQKFVVWRLVCECVYVGSWETLVFVRVYVWQIVLFFFFNDTATTEIYTLSLHDALPILGGSNGFLFRN